MINYYTRKIKLNKIQVNDYININDSICKILSINNNDNIYYITGINEINNIYKCLYDMNTDYYKNKQFIKYVFIYKYEIWRIQDFDDNDIEYLKKTKISDNFITYYDAEIYANKYIDTILDTDIAPFLDEIIIIKTTEHIDNHITKLFAKLS
jgi:hypothetical protein